MNPRILGMLVVLSALAPISSKAENLLTFNADFDSGPTTFFAGIQANDNGQVPGWRVVMTDNASTFTGIANDQGNIGTPNFAYVYGATTYETSAAYRAVITAGTTYYSGFNMRNDSTLNGANVFIDWYSDYSSYDPASLVGSVSLGNLIAGQAFVGSGSPYKFFNPAGIVAPAGATHDAVRFSTEAAAGQVIADDFQISTVPLEPPSALNLLAFNSSFDVDGTDYVGSPATITSDVIGNWNGDIAGWRITTLADDTPPVDGEDPALPVTWAGVANDQNNIGQPNFGYMRGLATLETDSDVRAPVTAGNTYATSYSVRNDTNLNGAEVFIDWYNNSNSFSGLISSTALGNQSAGVAFAPGDPFNNFQQNVVAPAGATHAAFRVTTQSSLGGVVIDNFVIGEAVLNREIKLVGYTVAVNSGQATLTWTSTVGTAYKITSSTNLTGWTEVLLDNITADTGSTTTRTVSFTAASRRFFRVEVKP